MINKIKNVIASDLVKVFSFTGLSTLVKLVTSYLTVKVVASIIGPSGIALIGQLQNFVMIMTTLGAGGINNGVVKYVSESRESEDELNKFISNGLRLTVYFSLFFAVLLILLSSLFSKWILLDEQYQYVFLFFGVTLLLLSLNNFFLSILNGYKDFKNFVALNIVTSVIGLIFTISLVLLFSLKGALIATVTYQGVVLFVTLFYLRKSTWFKKSMLLGAWDKEVIRKFLSYSVMALVSAATLPVSQLLVRSYLINNYSVASAGFWEGMNRISGLFLLFFVNSFSVYYLPKLSEIQDKQVLRREIINTYKIFAPILFVALLGLYLLKDLVISILFTKEFYPMKELFFWQLLGDFFKIISWILAFVMVAKSMTKIYIITEILFAALFVGTSYIFINKFGVIGATESYFVTYFCYFLVMLLIFRKLLFTKKI